LDDDVRAVDALPDGNDFGAVVVTGDPRVDGGVVQVVPPSVLDAVWMMSWAPSY
jgi:hypothetical protein